MAQLMKAYRRLDPRILAGSEHRPRLHGGEPRPALRPAAHQSLRAAPGSQRLEEIGAFRRQHNVARLAGLGVVNGDLAAVKVADAQGAKLAVAGARLQRRMDQVPEPRGAVSGVDQPLRLSDSQIAWAGRVHLVEGPETPPSCVVGHVSVLKSLVQCSL